MTDTLRKLATLVSSVFPGLLWDTSFFGGALLVVVGCWKVWHPLAFLIGGLFLAGIGYYGGLGQVRNLRGED